MVAQRAKDRLSSGDPVEAIHLAEISLTAEPRSTAALEVMVAAHEQLERESENFWLSQWLRKQIGDLRSSLEAVRAKESGS